MLAVAAHMRARGKNAFHETAEDGLGVWTGHKISIPVLSYRMG